MGLTVDSSQLTFCQVQIHVTQKVGKISKIQPNQI